MLLLSISSNASLLCVNLLSPKKTHNSHIAGLGDEKSVIIDGSEHFIMHRQRSVVKVTNLKNKSDQVFGNLALSKGKYWFGRINVDQVDSINILTEPRFFEDTTEAHVMLLVNFSDDQTFYMQDESGVSQTLRSLVLSINPQIVTKKGEDEISPLKLLRFRIIAPDEIRRKYDTSPPDGDIISSELNLGKEKSSLLVLKWLEASIDHGESRLFDYIHCNCATNLHEILKQKIRPRIHFIYLSEINLETYQFTKTRRK